MFFKPLSLYLTQFTLTLAPLLLISMASYAEGTGSYLFVKPTKCIALRQGQVCYQKLTFNWHSESIGDYCLYEKNIAKPIQCWQQLKRGNHKIDLQSDKNVSFVLRNEKTQQAVAETAITIAWVYKSRNQQKSSWRLF